jgi:SSS family transporter
LPSPLHALALTIPTTRLSAFDLGLVAVYLVAITLFGLRFREKKGAGKADKSLKSYFLANNTIPWWAIALSIVSAETSTLTIISIPGVAFAGDFGFLQIVLGYMLGRIVVATLFLPRYFAGEMLTAYQLIDQRFGPFLHKVTAALFLLTRAAAEGVRVFAVSIVVGIAIGTGDTLSIAIISALTLLYTFEGGMAAVVWTDVVQMIIYVGGTLVAVFTLGSHVTGGWSEIHTVASAAHKFHMFNFALNLTTSYTFWAGVLGGTFLTMASHGTDQLMVQRLLAARNLRESRLALLSSGVVIFIQFSLFLLIGVGLWYIYGPGATSAGPGGANMIHGLSSDRIFPTFIVNSMPVGVAGLLVAAILAAAMSNLSAALNSLSSTTVVDFYMHLRPKADDRERAIISKSSTVFWALVLFTIAVATISVGGKGHVVEIALSIASVAYGCLLGVFLVGTLTKFATEVGTAIGMVVGFVLNIWLWQGPHIAPYLTHIVSPNSLQRLLAPTKIAFTWYVIIGALVTFAIGSLASLIFRKQSRRTLSTATAALLLFAVILSAAKDPRIVLARTHAAAPPASMCGFTKKPKHPKKPKKSKRGKTPKLTADFTAASTLINDAIAAHKLPGAVLIVGHEGEVVFHHAYGNRKLAGEPGLDGNPSPAEPMTEDTIFDMASLTKDLATATAIMQLYEAGKIASFDDPIAKYLPEFLAPPTAPSAEGATPYQPGATPQVPGPQDQRAEGPAYSAAQEARAKVTIRMLLTHTSGETEDVSLKTPWGLATPDRAEGFRLALTTPLKSAPAAIFRYSDINFILLGMVVEKLSGQREDDYVREHIYRPLGMTHTRYLPLDKTYCVDKREIIGAAIGPLQSGIVNCLIDTSPWSPLWIPMDLLPNIAPTAHDDESTGNPSANPDFDHLLRGTVHDPTTRRMGGVAGHAGLFSTAHDVSLYAQALLDKLLRNTGPFPLKQSTLQMMVQPEQPGANLQQLVAANLATEAAQRADREHCCVNKDQDPLLAPAYPAIKGQNLRGYGWDIDTAFSKPRGRIFPIGSFGHTGFTGTTLWMDPGSDTWYVLLANAIHPRGGAPISPLRGEVATAAATALGLYGTTPASSEIPDPLKRRLSDAAERARRQGLRKELTPEDKKWLAQDVSILIADSPTTQTGIDVLSATNFSDLKPIAAQHDNHLRLGLFTNQAGINQNRRRTVDILATDLPKAIPTAKLTTLFAPEHGLAALVDSEKVPDETDAATGLHVTGLYGAKPAQRHPTHDMLKDLDAVVIDLQDAGVHFWTYEAAMGYFLEAASREKNEFNHRLDIIILDRPNLQGGLAVQGPVSDVGIENYTNYMPLPARHGMTFGELARYFNTYKLNAAGQPLDAPLTVIAMRGWTRDQFFDDTHLPWVNPSPNLRDPDAAILYPCIGLIDSANISVGRGTTEPFHIIGASFMNGHDVAVALTARHIPGVTFTPTTIPVAEDSNKYPYHGQTIEAIRFTVTDRVALDTPELGVEVLAVLHKLYPAHFQYEKASRLSFFDNRSTMEALARGDDPRTIAASWQPALDAFKANRTKILIY